MAVDQISPELDFLMQMGVQLTRQLDEVLRMFGRLTGANAMARTFTSPRDEDHAVGGESVEAEVIDASKLDTDEKLAQFLLQKMKVKGEGYQFTKTALNAMVNNRQSLKQRIIPAMDFLIRDGLVKQVKFTVEAKNGQRGKKLDNWKVIYPANDLELDVQDVEPVIIDGPVEHLESENEIDSNNGYVDEPFDF